MSQIDIQKTAIVAHETNRIWCMVNGDDSQPVWDDAPEWQQESAIAGIQFHLDNPDAGDSASHDSWMKQKLDAGWVYGTVKDPEASPPTHPCIVPFGDLPLVDQTKDALFRSIVHAILADQFEPTTTVTDPGFNPSGNGTIDRIKRMANKFADLIGREIEPGRRRSVALTTLEDASMWAVKAAAVGDD